MLLSVPWSVLRDVGSSSVPAPAGSSGQTAMKDLRAYHVDKPSATKWLLIFLALFGSEK